MKAKEYAQKYIEADDKVGALTEIANEFVSDFGEVALARNIGTGKAAASLLREFEQKWNAFCDKTGDPSIKRDGFRRLLEHVSPDMYSMLLLAEKGLV